MDTILTPFERPDLDILFVGLNPAEESNRNGHYFSVKSSLWEQLAIAGLITEPLHFDERWRTADRVVFGSTKINYRGWSYGVTDLLPDVVNSDSSAVSPKWHHGEELIRRVALLKPRMAIVLHAKVAKCIERVLRTSLIGSSPTIEGFGSTSVKVRDCRTVIARVPFPHGTKYSYSQIARVYSELKNELDLREPL